MEGFERKTQGVLSSGAEIIFWRSMLQKKKEREKERVGQRVFGTVGPKSYVNPHV